MSPLTFDISYTPRSITCSLDGRFLLTCGHWDRSIKLVQADAGRIIKSAYGHDDIVNCLAVSEDGRCLLTGCRSAIVLSWDIVASIQRGSLSSGITSNSSNLIIRLATLLDIPCYLCVEYARIV